MILLHLKVARSLHLRSRQLAIHLISELLLSLIMRGHVILRVINEPLFPLRDGLAWPKGVQPLSQRPYRLTSTSGTGGSPGEDELALEAEKRPLKRDGAFVRELVR
jgi:hypothetical protein